MRDNTTSPAVLWSRGGRPQLVNPPATMDGRHWRVDFNRGKVPTHALRVPSTPTTLSQAPLLAVEVAGLVSTRVTAGAGLELTAATDVGGFEIVSPRDASVWNVASQFPLLFDGPRLSVTVKWRGVFAPRLSLLQPGLVGPDGGQHVTNITPPFTVAPSTSVAVTASVIAGFEENTVFGSALQGGLDGSLNSFSSSSSVFAFVPGMVANGDLIDGTFRDAGSMQVEPGRYYRPAALDTMDVLYPAASDVAISDHLASNGLRPVAMKRNGGSLVSVTRVDGKDALADPLAFDVPDGYPLPSSVPEPLPEQLVDGDDVEYRDVLDSGIGRNVWMGSYNLGRWDLGVQMRSRLIQYARQKHGLPPSEDGVSEEYHELSNQGRNRILLDAIPALLNMITPFLREARAGLFFLEETATSSVAVAEIGETGAAVAVEVPASQVLFPRIVSLLDFPLAGDQQVAALATEYRAGQVVGRTGWAEEVLLTAAQDQMVNASTNLGIWAAQNYVEASAASGGLGLSPQQRVCCDGPQRGGAAGGKLDEVYLVRNAEGEVQRIVIVEAKGGQRYVNPLAKKAGRKVVIEGAEQYALQGTRQYLQKVAEIMSEHSDEGVHVAGTEIRAVLEAREYSKLEYYIVTAKWSGRSDRRGIGKGLAWGVGRVARVFRMVIE